MDSGISLMNTVSGERALFQEAPFGRSGLPRRLTYLSFSRKTFAGHDIVSPSDAYLN